MIVTSKGNKKHANIKTIQSFYENKSIQPSYLFEVAFDFSNGIKHSDLLRKYMSKLKYYHIVSVDIPFNSFVRISTNIGMMQYSFPVLASEQSLDIKITFEEDNNATIAGLIQALQRTVHRNGGAVSPYKSVLGTIIIYMYDRTGKCIGEYRAYDSFFLGASSINMSYSNNESVKYDMTFGTNYIAFEEYDNTRKRFINNDNVDSDIESYLIKQRII